MSKPLTIVLPVHDAEATLHRDVANVLEIAGDLSSQVRLFIIDDGSTDDTYDTAMELAARYPQIQVIHNAQQEGLGKAVTALRSRIADDCVLVHDGASPVDADQIRRLWLSDEQPAGADDRSVSMDDLHRAAALHASMEVAHGRLAGFHRLAALDDANTALTRRDQQRQAGVGVIPPLPRPNFMGALANFALGE